MAADMRGIQLVPALGLLIAELVARRTLRFETAPYRPDRFGQLMEHGRESIRAAARTGLRPGLYSAQPLPRSRATGGDVCQSPMRVVLGNELSRPGGVFGSSAVPPSVERRLCGHQT